MHFPREDGFPLNSHGFLLCILFSLDLMLECLLNHRSEPFINEFFSIILFISIVYIIIIVLGQIHRF